MMWRLFARRSFSCPKIAALAIQIVCCLLASATCAYASGYCAHFEFPDLGEDLVKTANAHTRVTIPFRLITNDTCSWNRTFVLVSEPSGRSAAGLHQDYCVVQVRRSGGCMSFSNTRCRCQGGKGDAEILFTKTVDRGDNGTWVWWTRERISQRVTVDFNIQEFATSASTLTTPTTTITTTTSTTTTTTTTTSITTQAEQLTATTPGSNDQPEDAAEGNPHQSISHSSGEDENGNNDDSISNGSSSSSNSNGDANVDEEDDNISSDDVGYDVDRSATAGASATMQSSYVGAGIVAGVNVTTIVVIGTIIVCLRAVCVRRGRRGQDLPPPPPPCSLNTAMTLRRRSQLQMEAQYCQAAEKLSLSSRIYEEIPVASVNEIKDTAIYLSPIAGADELNRK